MASYRQPPQESQTQANATAEGGTPDTRADAPAADFLYTQEGMSAIAPKAIRVNKTTGTGMEIDWQDGHSSRYAFAYLRDACPCATCDDEREAEQRDFGEPARPKNALPIYRDPARPEAVNPIGKYALQFMWNDGHATGIYSWEFLRMICPCAECKAKRVSLRPGGSGALPAL